MHSRLVAIFGIICFLLLLLSFNLRAADIDSQFYAEAEITEKRFKPNDLKPYAENVTGQVLFYYSNGWWRIEAKCTSSSGSKYTVDCKRIPDGVRRYFSFEGVTNGMTTAIACPITFPPPGNRESFLAWLSLCPSPDLPLIDSHRMHRFLSVPFCEAQLLKHPKNEGNYIVKYLRQGGVFISELSITNNGYSLEYEGYIGPYQSPFENGFPEMHYQVQESTNIFGFEFPLKAVAKFFAPKPTAKTREDYFASSIYEVSVKKYAVSQVDIPKTFSPPPQLVAIDVRPVGLPPERSIDYLVKNDSWKSSSEPQIVQKLRKINAAEGSKLGNVSNPSVTRAVLLLTLLLPLLFFIFSQKHHHKKTKCKNTQSNL